MSELSQDQLEKMVTGENPNPNVVFYETAKLNQGKSHAEGRRVYDIKVYVKKTQPGVTDWVAHVAQKEDIAEYKAEYNYFLNNKQGEKAPSIEMIPGLGIINMQELIDLGLLNIKALAEAIVVPPHLQYAQDKAKRIYSAMKDEDHGQEESLKESGFGAIDTRTEGRTTGGQETVQSGRDNRDVAVPEGCDRPQPSDQSDSRRNPERSYQGGQINRGQSIDNWSVSFNVG